MRLQTRLLPLARVMMHRMTQKGAQALHPQACGMLAVSRMAAQVLWALRQQSNLKVDSTPMSVMKRVELGARGCRECAVNQAQAGWGRLLG